MNYPAKLRLFEFNEKFLITINNASYSSQFGTFLFNCERERLAYRSSDGKSLAESTTSLWDFILQGRDEYINPVYNVDYSLINPTSGGSTPSASPAPTPSSSPPPSRKGKDTKTLSDGKVVIFPSSSHLLYWTGLVTGSEAIEIIDNTPSRSVSVGDESAVDKVMNGIKDMFGDKIVGDEHELVLEDVDEDVVPLGQVKKNVSVDYSGGIPIDHGGFGGEESSAHPLA
jgi:hypothetical protein